ncbi:hypothetical protein FGG78_13595 [Thioclava sp. BHET1]|nr:hypothetical protein FGG78_13595 [Thioclava sp. BHET1]
MARQHHLFIASPAAGRLGPQMARTLAAGHAQLQAAGYGLPVLGPHPAGHVHLDATLIGTANCGLFHFFAKAEGRAQLFARRLGAPVSRLVIQTVPYETYYPKMWRQIAARQPLKPFEGATKRLVERARGWVEVIGDLQRALQPREIVVLPAPVTVEEGLAALVPGASLAPRLQVGPDAGELSESAIAMMQRLFRANVTIEAQQLRRLQAFHNRQPQGAPIAAFDALDAAKLRRRYRQDMKAIGAMPGVRIGADCEYAIAAQ